MAGHRNGNGGSVALAMEGMKVPMPPSWACRNRTTEFFAIVEAVRAREPLPMPVVRPSSASATSTASSSTASGSSALLSSRTQFMRQAAAIGREINAVATKLQKLTALVKKKSLFDDRPVEIQELTYIINQDINALNHKIGDLQHSVGAHKATGGKQLGDHSNNVLVSLQTKLASTSSSFKNVLEIRTQNMKVQKDRRDQYSVNTPAGASSRNPMSSSILYRTRPDPSRDDSVVALDMPAGRREPGSPIQRQQMQLISQQDSYLETRSEEIRTIESTIVQLGDIFRQLGELVAQQGEQVARIDQNVDDVEANVTEAQNQLLKYLHSFGDSRWLMIKVFVVLILFFIVFVVFFA